MRLNFVKQSFGSYAENPNHALQDMEGHLLRGFGDRTVDSTIYPMPGAVEEADVFLKNDEAARQRLERVAQSIAGFESPYGMELLASIHWVAKANEAVATDATVAVEGVRGWNARKKNTFKAEHISKGWKRLPQEGWSTPESPDSTRSNRSRNSRSIRTRQRECYLPGPITAAARRCPLPPSVVQQPLQSGADHPLPVESRLTPEERPRERLI